MKAPGRANRATVLPENRVSVVTGSGPPSPHFIRVALGTLSPTLIVMTCLASCEFYTPVAAQLQIEVGGAFAKARRGLKRRA